MNFEIKDTLVVKKLPPLIPSAMKNKWKVKQKVVVMQEIQFSFLRSFIHKNHPNITSSNLLNHMKNLTEMQIYS